MSEQDWPKLSEGAVWAGMDDPFLSKLTADMDTAGRLADRIDPEGKFLDWLRRHREWCLADPKRIVVVMRMWVQTGRLPS